LVSSQYLAGIDQRLKGMPGSDIPGLVTGAAFGSITHGVRSAVLVGDMGMDRVQIGSRGQCIALAERNPGGILVEPGHSLAMFFKVYAKWIDRRHPEQELAKIEAALRA
jgi:hypothetical protein